MPEMDGFEMVRRIRETDGETPILFASALTSPKDVRHGYKLGVNNYVKKPFVPEEIDAHIHAILKMKAGGKSRSEEGCCQFSHYTLDTGHATLRNDNTGSVFPLTGMETKIMQLLAENKNEVHPPRSHPEPLLEYGRQLFRFPQPGCVYQQAPQALYR